MGALKKIARRTFLIGSTAVAGGVAFGVYSYKSPLANPLKAGLKDGEAAITPYVKIAQDGVTLITPRADKGQGVYSMQAYLLAEELDVDPMMVKTSPGIPSKTYYNSALLDEMAPGAGPVLGKLMGMQITGGSSTVPDLYVRLRHAGAVARETLKMAAAKQFDMDVSGLKTDNGHVILSDGRKVSYVELASQAAKIKPVTDVALRPESQWRYLGKAIPRTDMVAKSTGTQVYGIDLQMDGMVYATVRTNPGMGGVVDSYDAKAAEAMRGVKKIMPITSGIAVIADNSWRAIQAANAVDITWGPGPYPATSAEMWTILEDHNKAKFKNIRRKNEGNVEKALDSADVISAEYRVPHLAHAPLEPINAVLKLQKDRLDIWTGTQIPLDVQRHAAKQTGLPAKSVHVHVEAMGGSFGHRLEDAYVLQAIEIAKAMPDVPIKLTWSREEDFSHDYTRPMGLAVARGLVTDGQVETLDLGLVGASLTASQFGRLLGFAPPGPDPTLTTGADDQPYAIPHYRVTGYKAPEMVPISSWRSVAASQNGFFHECFLDELIHAAGADPLEERIRLCNDPLSVKVLEEVGAMCNWNGPDMREGRGRGVAFTLSFGVRTAEIVEVVQTPNGIKIDKVWAAAEVGKVLDPVNFEAQFFGGIIWGLGHAMNCELTYEDYAPIQSNFDSYQGMRLYQTPTIMVKGLENGDKITGMGEPGVPPAAPALANAIFAATGQRIRELPLYNTIDFA